MTNRQYWETEAENFKEILKGLTPEDKNYSAYQKALANAERRLEELNKYEVELKNLENKGQQMNNSKDTWFEKGLKIAAIIVPVIGTCATAYIVSNANVKQEMIHQQGQLNLQLSELDGGKSMLTAAQNEARRNIPNTKFNLRT